MSACGIFSIVSSAFILLFMFICNKARQNKEKTMVIEEKAREKAHASIIKQLDIHYSKVPISEDKNQNLKAVEKSLLSSL